MAAAREIRDEKSKFEAGAKKIPPREVCLSTSEVIGVGWIKRRKAGQEARAGVEEGAAS